MSHSQFTTCFASISIAAVTILLSSFNLCAQQSRGPNSGFDFPYQAIVRYDGTEIFSGPAAVHYATDRIEHGEIVQVYRHDPGGWCAIRPNEGSFSLIPESAVKITDDGIGQITQDNTQAWVGTRLGSVEKPLWQIKLTAGEEVQILGEASWPSPDGHSTIWYQIAPPAGEFRWIRFADLQPPPTDGPGTSAAQADVPQLATEPREIPATGRNQTQSGFKYVQPANKESTALATSDPASNFRYVTPAQPLARPQLPGTQPAIAQPPVTGANQQQAWSQQRTARIPSHDIGADASSQPDRILNDPAPPETVTASRALPKRQTQNAIDFKFRPIGTSATLSGSFQKTQSEIPEDENTIRDRAVTPAAFQSPVYDPAPDANARAAELEASDRGAVGGARWQRARSEIAQQKDQYEARYDRFNARQRFDQRAVEDSFGLRLDDLPARSLPSQNQQNYNRGIGTADISRGQFHRPIESTRIPDDRYASLSTSFDTMPHSSLSEKLTARLSKIEEQLTNEMLKRPNEWQLADLELNVGQIYSQTSNPMERLQSQRILDKISKCKVIRNGYTKSFQASGETFGTSVQSLNDTRDVQFALGEGYSFPSDSTALSSSIPNNNPFAAVPSPPNGAIIGSGIDTDFEINARFDATGWLTELVSEDRNNRPVYVLVNDSGQITHHIVATPGLNLHRYLKSKIGVSGRRGYNNRMKLDHITAEQVDELQRF